MSHQLFRAPALTSDRASKTPPESNGPSTAIKETRFVFPGPSVELRSSSQLVSEAVRTSDSRKSAWSPHLEHQLLSSQLSAPELSPEVVEPVAKSGPAAANPAEPVPVPAGTRAGAAPSAPGAAALTGGLGAAAPDPAARPATGSAAGAAQARRPV
eukprot:CAMPEP_0168389682 /NCGR_PEP_ID=MMETSP0228-20121227/17087_1 /TAXON_ID=133427 /ORGANISM="Protoceratium reticulatum, Strain CCCM 535 (=CCMP 1889)" /LENGTH=155 /DNA_ID=CAMNT_0008402957 /DNA_START=57 /DNA_END=525 /DNA_ORIENTATION=+